MNTVPFPKNYGSLENLSKWLMENMPPEEHWGNVDRWKIISPYWVIRFQNPADATWFTLTWPR
jgi:hypothetical protein